MTQLRAPHLSQALRCRPVIVLNPERPTPAVWERVAHFGELYWVQGDPKAGPGVTTLALTLNHSPIAFPACSLNLISAVVAVAATVAVAAVAAVAASVAGVGALLPSCTTCNHFKLSLPL